SFGRFPPGDRRGTWPAANGNELGVPAPSPHQAILEILQMQYHCADDTVNMTVLPLPVRKIDAHSVPHLKASKASRAVDGADILDGIAKLENLTLRLVAAGMGVSADYLVKARRLTPEQRQAVRNGKRPLVLPRTPAEPSKLPVAVPPRPFVTA